jgi:NAD(P)-dependent dehydrogenase (short-subunit alcohol dehydrogenase family)
MTSGNLADGIGGSAARKLAAAGGDLIAAARLRIPGKAGWCMLGAEDQAMRSLVTSRS